MERKYKNEHGSLTGVKMIRELLKLCCDQAGLIKSLVKREIEGKYRGTLFGLFWMLIYPLMMLSVYTFVFAGVFGARWGGGGDWTNFVPMLYAGLVVHAIFSEVVGKAPNQVVGSPNYVKKVIFPLELLSLVNLFAALSSAAIGFMLLILMNLTFNHVISWTIIFLPFALVPLALFSIGFSWAIAALGVFFRDIEQVIGVLLSMLLFLSPIFYSVEAAPPLARALLVINPLSYPIAEVRNLVILGGIPNWPAFFVNFSLSLVIAWVGLWIFTKARPAFADVV